MTEPTYTLAQIQQAFGQQAAPAPVAATADPVAALRALLAPQAAPAPAAAPSLEQLAALLGAQARPVDPLIELAQRLTGQGAPQLPAPGAGLQPQPNNLTNALAGARSLGELSPEALQGLSAAQFQSLAGGLQLGGTPGAPQGQHLGV